MGTLYYYYDVNLATYVRMCIHGIENDWLAVEKYFTNHIIFRLLKGVY